MKRITEDTILTIIVGVFAGSVGLMLGSKMPSSPIFQISFGIVFGAIIALLIGGVVIQVVERRRADEMKKRVRMTSENGKTSIIIEPK